MKIPRHIEVVLIVLLEYLYAQARRDYEENQKTGHLFNSLRAVAEWMEWKPE